MLEMTVRRPYVCVKKWRAQDDKENVTRRNDGSIRSNNPLLRIHGLYPFAHHVPSLTIMCVLYEKKDQADLTLVSTNVEKDFSLDAKGKSSIPFLPNEQGYRVESLPPFVLEKVPDLNHGRPYLLL